MAASILRAMVGTDSSSPLNCRWDEHQDVHARSRTPPTPSGAAGRAGPAPRSGRPGPRVATFFPLRVDRRGPADDDEELESDAPLLHQHLAGRERQLVERASDLAELGRRAAGEQPDGLEVERLGAGGHGWEATPHRPGCPGRCTSRLGATGNLSHRPRIRTRHRLHRPTGDPCNMIAAEPNRTERPGTAGVPADRAAPGRAGRPAGHHASGRHRRRGHPAGRPGGARGRPGRAGRHRVVLLIAGVQTTARSTACVSTGGRSPSR